MEDFLKQINQDIKDIFQYNIETTNTFNVPARNDAGLTFPIGADKKGKTIETCVLMIDIRNSTKICRQLKNNKIKMGKIYSAFIYAMAKIADDHGYVRNIIGDRVMVVFEPKNCFVDAINCAALMYTVSTKILAKYVAMEDFKVGIGIDFGEMLVLKTGIIKKHEEQSEYKSLVWVGDAANISSKLADLTNKSYKHFLYKITYQGFDFEEKLTGYSGSYGSPILDTIMSATPKPIYKQELVFKPISIELNCETFCEKVEPNGDGWKYNGSKILSLSKENKSGSTSPILISGKVYDEYKKATPDSPFVKNFAIKVYPNAPLTGSGIYGGVLILPEINKLKIV